MSKALKWGFFWIVLLYGQNALLGQFESSNLPIIIIDTEGQSIPDEPKITARMKIIDNPDGQRNNIYDPNPFYDGFIGIELRGQSSLGLFPKKGYGIETRDENGGNLNVSILGMPEENDWVIHSPYSDKTLMRNALSYRLAERFMDYSPRTRFAELLINDSYEGVIVWTEKIKRDANRVNISKLNPDENSGDDLTGGYILKFDKEGMNELGWISPYQPFPYENKQTRFLLHYPKPRDITTEQRQYIQNFVTTFEHSLMNDDPSFPINEFEQYIDVETFAKTVIINELTRNVDGYRLSTYMYKDKDSEDGRLKMGPTWDHNLSWGNADYCLGGSPEGWAYNFNYICPGDYWQNHTWWFVLMMEPNFRQLVKDQWFDLRKDILSNDAIIGMINEMVDELSEARYRNFEKWPVIGQYIWPNNYVGESYEDEINYLKIWILQRTNWLDANFKELTTNTEDHIDLSEIKVYPNPNTGILKIKTNQAMPRSIEFYNAIGQKVCSFSLQYDNETLLIKDLVPEGLIWYKIILKDGKFHTGNLIHLKE